MSRRGLSREIVVDRAQAIADERGLDALDLTVLAEACGVRKPSLYKHVDGLPDLLGELAARACAALSDALAREGSVAGLARAWRSFALRHPGLYAAAVPNHVARTGRAREAAEAALGALLSALRAEGLDEEGAIHAARALRALVHGFVALERAQGFGLDTSVEESFERGLAALLHGLGLPCPAEGTVAPRDRRR